MVPPNSVKMFASEICNDVKNTGIVNLVGQKIDFWESTFGGFRGEEASSNYFEIFVCLVSVDIKQQTGSQLIFEN